MDMNDERTDRFFRERLSVYEEIPGDQVWDKIASRLEVEKRRKLVYLFIRIAAGMTLLLSLGLGYHLIYRSGHQKAVAVNAKTSVPGKPEAAGSNMHKSSSASVNLSLIAADKTSNTESKHQQLNNNRTDTYSALLNKTSDKSPLINSSPAGSKTTVLARIAMLEPSLLPSPAPHRLGYRRLSREEMQEQTAALMADNNEYPADEGAKADRWMLGSEVAPLYSYRKIESDYLGKSAIQDMNNSEQGLIALAGGLRVGYSAGRRLSVQSGIYYSRYGQEKNNGEAISVDQFAYLDNANVTYLSIPNSTGTIQSNDGKTSRYEGVITSSTGNKADFLGSGFPALTADDVKITDEGISAVQYFDYLELPVTLKYKIIDRKLSFSFLGGLITNFLVNNGVQLKQDGHSESYGSTRDINKVNYQGSVGLGFDYPIMDRMSVSLEPRFRYYLNPIDQRFNVHPYSFGIFAGFSYSLK
jgi:hypothetical protein